MKHDLIFMRFGGLSAVEYKAKVTGLFSDFHAPPEPKGIYAFIFPYHDSFLWAWNNVRYKNIKAGKEKVRRFKYSGPIWCHFTEYFPCNKQVGAWVLIHTDDLPEGLKRCRKADRVSLLESFRIWDGKNFKIIPIRDPYKSAPSVSVDHLEVFIPARHLNKIK